MMLIRIFQLLSLKITFREIYMSAQWPLERCTKQPLVLTIAKVRNAICLMSVKIDRLCQFLVVVCRTV